MSTANIEINMPNGASEVTLKTAGKYCAKDIHVTAPFSHRTEKGTFTPTANSFDKFTITGVPTDARLIEIAAITGVSEVKYSESQAGATVPITHAAWAGAVTKRIQTANIGLVEYDIYIDTVATPYTNHGGNPVTAKLLSDGLTFTLSGKGANFAFEQGVTYEWTAHFYED